MKHGKKPTRRQKIFLDRNEYIPDNWLVVKDIPESLTIKHRVNGRVVEIKKGA